jgi:hypothetical protein
MESARWRGLQKAQVSAPRWVIAGVPRRRRFGRLARVRPYGCAPLKEYALPRRLASFVWVRRVAAPLLLAALLAVPSAQVAIALPCGPAPEISEPTPEAREIYKTALELVEKGRFAEALAAFERAYEKSPSYVILYNVGKAAVLSGDAARALSAYQCHLEHGGAAIEASQHSEVTAEIARLRGEVGLVVIEVDEPGASIEIDGKAVGTSPLEEPVPVNPGKNLVRVRGSRSETRAIDVDKGARFVVKFELAAQGKPPPSGPPFRFPGAVVGISWVVAGLLGVSTAVTGSLALVGEKDIENDVFLGPSYAPPEDSDLADKIERTRTLAIASDVLLTAFCITGSAAISFSVVNAVSKDDGSPPAPKVGAFVVPGGVFFRAELP